MNTFPKTLIAVFLVGTLMLFVQSCNEQTVPLEKSKVQFTLSPGTPSNGRAPGIELPEGARLEVTISTTSGTPVFSGHEVQVRNGTNGYMSDPMELMPGNYVITDFMIVNDTEVLNAVPKSQSPFSEYVMHSLPYNFSVTQDGLVSVNMQLIDARNEKPEAFGYTSFKGNKANKLSFIVSKTKVGHSLKFATAELRQGRDLIKTFPVHPGVNTIEIDGEQDAEYALSVVAGEMAQVKTFNFKELKQELGAKPLKMELEPALLLTLESSVDEANENGELFEFVLEGSGGKVNVHWGNGRESRIDLPLNDSHEYTFGTYTAIITGDLDKITNLYGFSYGTVILGIRGLTNLTSLKTYNPSWGAVPINIDLSNCHLLETVWIEKLGAPYEPIDLLTDFKLPKDHSIKEFVFYVPSLDPTRENITAEELEMLVDNIYTNAMHRDFYDGKFFVYPVDAPSQKTQEKLDILQNQFNWDVRLDGNIWGDPMEGGRIKYDMNALRDRWLLEKFPGNKRIQRSADIAFAN